MKLSCLQKSGICSTNTFPTFNFLKTEYGWWQICRTSWSASNFLLVGKMNQWVGVCGISVCISEPCSSIWEGEWGIVKYFNRKRSLPETDYLNLSSPLHFANTNMIPAIYQTARRGIRFQFCVECGLWWSAVWDMKRGWNGTGETRVLCF